MGQIPNSKHYDLEERTLNFSKQIVRLCRQIPRNPVNDNLTSQLSRSATSIGANYREANDALGKKDFSMRVRIARKEAKETIYWLELIEEADPNLQERITELKQECMELRNILSAIAKKAV